MRQRFGSTRKLLLWDIDGTLFVSDRVGESALLQALRDAFGVEGAMHGIEPGGRTDRHIAQELLRANGIEPEAGSVHDFFEAYLLALESELPRGNTRLLPGVVEILEAVAARRDLAQGLLTGNLERGAQLKLERFDAWRFFKFGAFGEDGANRNDLGAHALRRAADHHACEFHPACTFVIGDTPHDIACGKAIGAHTIAVATGRHDAEALASLGPTAVLPGLDDAAAFLRVIDAFPSASMH